MKNFLKNHFFISYINLSRIFERLDLQNTVTMLEKEFKYYLDHQQELVEKYNGKTLVIVGEEVVGIYDSEAAAYFDSITKYQPGTFLVQNCSPGAESYTQTFHSRVIFA